MAVVLGCNLGLPEDKPLSYATRDAQQVYATLTQLGGVDKGRGYLLFDPKVSKVMTVFAEARNRIRDARAAGEKVQFLIYFSGHGSQEALHINGEKLPLAEIRAYFRDIEADLKLLIADACHSGALIQPKGAALAPAAPIRYQDELKVNGSAILTSSSAGEMSQESLELKGSLFTHFFLSALRGAADFDRDGQITLWEAYNHAQSGLRRRLAGVKDAIQNPGFDVDIQGSDNVVLTRMDLGQAFLQLKGLPEGEYRILEAAGGTPFAEVSLAGPEGATLALPKAAYLVFRAGTARGTGPASAGFSGSAGSAGYADLRRAGRVTLSARDFSPLDPDRLAAKGGSAYYYPRRAPLQVSLQPRLYSVFPGRGSGAPVMEATVQGAAGDLAFQAGFAWLPLHRLEAAGMALDQKGTGVSGEIRYYWRYSMPVAAFAGPRLELWSLDQALNGREFGRARMLGTFGALGLERMLSPSLRLGLSLEAGLFWSYDAAGALRRTPAYPVSFALRYGQ